MENKVTIGKHVTSISRITMENIASLAAEDLTFESHWIHLDDMTQSSQLKVPLNTLQEGDYYIDAKGVIYSWNEEKNAATLVYCPPHLTDYTIPEKIPVSAEENAKQIPVTAVGSYAFGQAQKLKTLQFENIGQVDTIADFAFARALCLASINGMTTETEINAHFATGVSLGLLPYQNTLITGAAEEDPTTEGFTAALPNNDGNSTFILSVKTSRSSNSNYEPAIDGGVKQFYTDEKATMSVTLTNPGSYEVTEDGGYVARIYMQFDKTDVKNGATLADAYFALYSPAQADQMAEASYNALTVTKKPAMSMEHDGKTWYLKSVNKTEANGTLTWAELTESDYLYVEVQAPNGYNLDSTVQKVTRPTGGGTASVTVTNRPGYNLPETGGIGTWPFMTAGLLLTGTALALLLKKRKTNN